MKALAAFLLFLAFSAEAQTVVAPPGDALWDSTGTAAAAVLQSDPRTRLAVFIKTSDGGFLMVDISHAENANLGRLGLETRKKAERIVTTPIEWVPRSDGRYMVIVRTRVWIQGKRYTLTEPVLFDSQGTVEWR